MLPTCLTCLPKNLGIMCTKGICGEVSINTPNQYPQSTSWSILDRHLNQYSVDSRLTLDQQSVDSRLSGDWLICINQNLVDFQPTVKRDVDRVSIKCHPRCHWGVDWVSIKGQSSISIGGIDWHSTATAFSTLDASIVSCAAVTRPRFQHGNP